MNITSLSDPQKRALLNLLILGMYADHNLALAEDDCIQKLLKSVPSSSELERRELAELSIARMSKLAGSPESIRVCVQELASSFPSAESRRIAYDALRELLQSDSRIAPE